MSKGPGVMSVLIVDDEPLARRGLRHLLSVEPDVGEVREAGGGEEAIRLIRERPPDVVLLDVQMPRVDGFGVIEAIGAATMPPVIFVTAFDAHALRAFETQAVDYLLKPVDPARLRDALDRAARARTSESLSDLRAAVAALTELARAQRVSAARASPAPAARDERFRVHHDGRVTLVDPREVLWIESSGNYVLFHLRGATLRHRATIAQLAHQFGESFVQIRRSTLVQAAAIRVCEPYGKGSFVVVLQDGTRLQSSRYFRNSLSPFVDR